MFVIWPLMLVGLLTHCEPTYRVPFNSVCALVASDKYSHSFKQFGVWAMKMSENPSEIADALVSSEQPWVILERIKQDPNLSESHEIQSTIMDIIRKDTDLKWPMLKVVCAIPAMVTDQRIHKAVKELGGLAIDFFVEAVVLNASKDSLNVLADDKSFANMIESCYSTITVLSLILDVPKLRASKTIRNAAMKNKKGLYQSIDDELQQGGLSYELKIMQQYPEILVSDNFIDVLVEVLESPHTPSDILIDMLDIPQLRENPRIWGFALNALTEHEFDFSWISDYFEIDWHLLAKYRRASSIEGIRESVDRLIQERGWKLIRAALIREYAYCENRFVEEVITEEEMLDARHAFFEIFDLRAAIKFNISMKDVLFGVEDADSLEMASKKAEEQVIRILNSKKKSRG